jgi:hypothetical protein
MVVTIVNVYATHLTTSWAVGYLQVMNKIWNAPTTTTTRIGGPSRLFVF